MRDEQRARIDELAAAEGVNRSEMLRGIVTVGPSAPVRKIRAAPPMSEEK